MSNTNLILKELQKKFGNSTISKGMSMENPSRLPTGITAFDLATGGGFPQGRISIVYGPESSGKTNLALLAIAMNQRLHPEKVNAMVDIEGSFDRAWAMALGVDCDKLIYCNPDYAEQAVDIIESLLYADDIGIVLVDSIAALITTNEIESSADKAVVGGSALTVGKLARKAVLALTKSKKEGKSPTLICINQIRHKIGVMYGDPETLPGGFPLKFASSMTVRIYGKGVIDKKVNPKVPVIKDTSFIIKKWKCPITNIVGEYKLVMIPHDGLSPGECDDWNTISTYLKEMGELAKGEKGGWVMLGSQYDKLDSCREKIYKDKLFAAQVREKIVQWELSRVGIFEEGGDKGEEQQIDESKL